MDRQAAQNTRTPLFPSPFVLLVLPTSYSGTLILVPPTREVRVGQWSDERLVDFESGYNEMISSTQPVGVNCRKEYMNMSNRSLFFVMVGIIVMHCGSISLVGAAFVLLFFLLQGSPRDE